MVEFLMYSLGFILIALPVAVVKSAEASNKRFEASREIAAQRFRCERCGELLGQASLQRADQIWTDMIAELRQTGVRYRVKQTIFAVCAVCGAEYGYDENRATFYPFVYNSLPHPQSGRIDSSAVLPDEPFHPET